MSYRKISWSLEGVRFRFRLKLILIFFCNLSVSAWQWCNDYFPTLNKFRSVHGYGLLYFTRHRVLIAFNVISVSLVYTIRFLLMDLSIHMFTYIFYRIAFTCSFLSYYLYRILIRHMYHWTMFYVDVLWSCTSIVLLYMAGPHVKQPLADESSWLNMF